MNILHARVFAVVVIESALLLGVGQADDSSAVIPLPRAHAHNDYEYPRPLFDALDRGFCSVEADIWLVEGRLLVAHDRKDLKPERTLQSLYLDPLQDRIQASGGRVYPSGPPFYLLIDVKSDAESTYAALDKVLPEYSDILTAFRTDKRDEKPVTAILSGNRAAETVAKQPLRYIGIDGRPENLDANPSPDLYPWISANWTLLFKANADGTLPAGEKQRLADFVRNAHDQRRQVRFWATPEKETLWKELVAVNVDFINTDKLDELKQFLLTHREPNANAK